MVLDNSYEVTAAQLRQRCKGVNDVDWTDQQLLDVSAEIEADAHIYLKKSSAFDEVSESIKFLAMKQVIKEGVASVVLASQDQYENEAKEAKINYLSKRKQLRYGRLEIITGGPNLTDELNPANYTPEASESY